MRLSSERVRAVVWLALGLVLAAPAVAQPRGVGTLAEAREAYNEARSPHGQESA